MLLFVAATHTENNCPGYNKANIPMAIEAYGKRKSLEKKYHVKIHFALSGAPAHVYYFLLETEKMDELDRFLWELIIIPSSFQITPVQDLETFIEGLGPWEELR